MSRVLWLTEHYPPSKGGMAESCDRIVRGLRGSGVEVDVAHLTRRVRPWKVEREHGGRLLTAPLGDDPEHALRRLLTALQAERLSHSHVVAFGGTYAMLAGPVLAALQRAPLITLLRGNDIDIGAFSLRRRGVLVDALRASSRVCVVARSQAPLVTALLPDAAVTFVPNGIDTGTWQILPSERERARAWRDANVPGGRRTLGLIGRLKGKKGVGFLLDAVIASGHAGSFHLVLVGEVEESVTGFLASADGIAYSSLPFLERYDLPAVYASCDLVGLPSFYDGMPNVALEAAGLGVPLLASDAGGLADVADEEIGFVFPAGDAHACRAAVDRAARAGEDELAKRGTAAAERIRRDFTPAAETAGYLRVLSETG
jgi:glycosyltransferase involved in cell wall biosynthesis